MNLNKAIFISLIVHVILFAALLSNFQFPKKEIKQSAVSSPIKARAINSNNVKKHIKNIKQKETDKRKKETERLRKLKKQEDDSRKKRIEEDNKVKKAKERQADAVRKRKIEEKKADDAKKKRVADNKARKKKVALDKKKALEKKRKADAEKKRLVEVERKRKKKIDEEKKRKERERQKKIAEEKAEQQALEDEMLQQMADESAELQSARNQQVLSEVEKYNLLISNKIKRNWIEPEQKGSCTFRINLGIGGLIIGISALSGDKLHCDSGRRAINKSEPLPVSSDPDIFAVLKVRTFELENNTEKNEYDN
jgi:colicin import membrane protein